MAKIKLENLTKSKIFLGGFCFVPGVTETCELTKAEEGNIKSLLDTKFMKTKIKEKLIIVHEIKDKSNDTKDEKK